MPPDLTPQMDPRNDSGGAPRQERRREVAPYEGDLLRALSGWAKGQTQAAAAREEWGLGRLLGDVLDAIMALQEADFGGLHLYRPDDDVLELVVHRNFSERFQRQAVRRGEGSSGRCLETGARVIVEDVETDPAYARWREFAAGEGYRSLQSTPLLGAGGQILGTVSTLFARPRRPTDRELHLTDHYARQAAMLIERHLFEAQLIEAKAAAERASEGKSRFLALVSHELRTPISAILGYTHLLLEGIPEPIGPRASDQVQRVAACATYLTEVIDQVLEYSRLEAGEDTVHLEDAQVGEIVREVTSVAQPLAQGKGLGLRVRTDHAPASLHTDSRRLRQILLNLLGNAVKFAEEGEISLTVRRAAGRVLFHVSDQGCGIAPADIETMFEPFVQGERPPGSGRRGAGLGLAISRMFARGLGGDLVAESEPGRGSTFTLWLPEESPAG